MGEAEKHQPKDPARGARKESIISVFVFVFAFVVVVGSGVGMLYALIRFLKWAWTG